MTETIADVIDSVKQFSTDQKNTFFEKLLDDPEIRKDLFDLLLVFQTEAEKKETVSLEEYISGKRTYSDH